MANNTIKGLTIEIGGDTTKLGKALDDVNKHGRDLSKELGEINKLLKLDPGNTELLSQKQKVLASAISNTAQKLDTLKDAEKQVQQQFKRGEVSEEQVRALQREIIQTEKALEGYEKAAKETAGQIDNVGKESEEAEKKTNKFGETAKAVGKAAAAGFAAVAAAAAAAATALAKCSVDAAAYADTILTQSTVTGISTEKLQAYSYAAELVDVSVETLTKSHAKQIKSMQAVQNGTKQMVEAYEKLGVGVTNADGSLRDGETVYWEVIDALGKMENETERDALAMQILGKSAQELNPLIEAGAERMQELTQEAQDVGAIMSEDTLSAMGAFDDSIQRLNGSAGAAKNALGGVLLPELTSLATDGAALLAEFTTNLNASGGGLEGFISTVDSMAGKIGEKAGEVLSGLISKLSDLAPAIAKVGVSLIGSLATSILSQAPAIIETGIRTVGALLQGVASALPGVVSAVEALIPQLVSSFEASFPELVDGFLELLLALVAAVDRLIEPLTKSVPKIVMCIVNTLLRDDTVAQLIDGALTLLLSIIDAIPLLIEQLTPLIPSIVIAVVAALIKCTPQLLQAALTLFLAIAKSIPQACTALKNSLPQIWQTISAYLSQLGTKAKDYGASLVQGLWAGINNSFTWLKNKLKSWVGNVTTFLKKLFGINSPSKVTAYMGEMLDEGFAKGIEDNAKAPEKAMGSLAQNMLDEARGVDGLAIERQINHSYSVNAAAAAAQSTSLLGKLDAILAALERGQILTIDGDKLVGATVNSMNSALGQRRLLAERGAL